MANLANWLPLFTNILPTNTSLPLLNPISPNISPPILGDKPIHQSFSHRIIVLHIIMVVVTEFRRFGLAYKAKGQKP